MPEFTHSVFYWTGVAFWSCVIVAAVIFVLDELKRAIKALIFALRIRHTDSMIGYREKRGHFVFVFFLLLWWELYRRPRRAMLDGNNLIWWPGTTRANKIEYHRINSMYVEDMDDPNLDFWDGPAFDINKWEGGRFK